MEQADQSMSGAIRIEQVRDRSSRLEQTEMRRIIRLDQSGVKASGEKTRKVGVEREHHEKKEDPCQKKKWTVRKIVRSRAEQAV